MADLATLQGWLVEAETARHKLMTGALRASVTYNGNNMVSFAKTDIDKLDAYIASLRSQIAGLSDTSDAAVRLRPINFSF